MPNSKFIKSLAFLICIFSLVVIGITLSSTIFPALTISKLGESETTLEPFELGVNAYVVLLGNILLIGFGILYYKKKLPSLIQSGLTSFLHKNISVKLATIIILIILIPYTVVTVPELFIDERTQAPDYEIFLAAKKIFPFGQTTFTEASEQNDRYVRMILLIASLDIFQNVKIIPFLGSIALLVTTYFLTKEITQNRLAGIVSMLILIQSYTFLRYDSFAMYENFWALFYVVSLYVILKKHYLSSISYILSILTKAFTAIFLPMSLVFIYFSNITARTKILITVSYGIMFGVVFAIWTLDTSVYSNIIRLDPNQLLIAFTKASYQLRFDILILVTILPLTIALIMKVKQGVYHAAAIMFLITGTIFAGPIVEMLSDHFVILPYRFIPTIVFVAVGVGILFYKKPISKSSSQ